ncbi:MAG: EAL domain-containing protein [Desulforegulaceae bacterium]|nr:EAL domain-containing protein [Desulforegulaceae bacterium]
MKSKTFKNMKIGKKLLASYLGLVFFVILISSIFTVPLVNDIMHQKINNELESSINLFHNLVATAADLSIKNHLKTIVKTNIETINFMEEHFKDPLKKQELTKKILSKQTIGKTGYIYIIDTNGRVIIHPQKDMPGKNVLNYDFIQKKLNNNEGYIEYQWKNPDEKNKREKALYFMHFKKWNWIVSASSYKNEFKDLLKIEELEKNIKSLKFGRSGYAFIIDLNGNFLIHPSLKGKNVRETDFNKGVQILDEIKSTKSGRIEYKIKGKKDNKPKEKIMYYKLLEDYDLIICASGFKNELYSERNKIFLTFGLSFMILIILIIPITILLTKTLTKPLELFIDNLKNTSKNSLNLRLPYNSNDEIGKLAKYFNRFMDEILEKTQRLEAEIEERKNKEEEIKTLAKFPDDNPNPVLRVDLESRLTYFNETALKTFASFKLEKGSKLPETITEIINESLRANTSQEIEYTDSNRTFSITVSPFKDINSAYIYAKEITAQKAYESLMVMSEAFFQNSIEGICITDPQGKIIRINPLFTQITGYSREEVKGKNPRILKSDKHDRSFYEKMWQSLIHTGQWTGEIWNRRKNGQAYPEWLSITAIRDKDGKITNYIGVFHDITESILNKEKIHYQTYHDATTGLPNRKLFTDITEQKISFSRKKRESFALLFIDINNFKNINDTLGHITGDKLLYLFAKRLKDYINEEMIIARFVGDKFIILAPEASNQNHILKEASDIQKIIEGPYKIDDREIFCGSNIGISLFPQDGETAEILIKNAEMAMYRSKNKGKRTIVFFTPSMDESAAKQLETQQNLAYALSNNEFELYYQPKISLSTGKITGAEALIRWIKNNKIISPALFIPIAEETGHIIPIGEWVMKKAFEEMKYWHDHGYDKLEISVNLSGAQFHDPELIDKIRNIFSKTKAKPEFVKFEITESVVMSDPLLASQITEKIKEMGSKISIDDFGTGYSSLGYLKKFPVDELKIDKSFLEDFPDSNEDVSIIKSILSLASNLNLKVTAEGVETKIQADVLKTLNCNEIQGFYFSRPLPAKDFYSLLKSGKRLFHMKNI